MSNPVPKYVELEREWEKANLLGDRSVISCSTGSAALHLALESFRLPPGAVVAVPDFTMVACAQAVTLARLHPVFVDVDHDTLTMCPDSLDGVLQRVVDTGGVVGAVMPVAVYGRPVVDDVYDVANKYGARIVEDLAEAHGVQPHAYADAGCWSFYRNKIIAGEEGGAVWMKDPTEGKLCRSLKSMGFTADHDYTHIPHGWNYRLADALASIILGSLANFRTNVATRRAIELTLDEACPEQWRMPYRSAPWVYDIRIPGMLRGIMKKVVATLQSQGVQARCGFKPMTEQDQYQFKTTSLSNDVARVAGNEVFYLPFTTDLITPEKAKWVFRLINQALPAFLRLKGV